MPELWTTIQYPSMGCRNIAELRAVLARSGHTSRALSVTLKSSICDDDGILDELSKHAHRIKSFGTTQCWPISVTPQGFVPFFALLRPERLRLDGMGCLEVVNALSSNSTGLFSELISLVVPGTPFPTECQPIPTLLELDCLFSANTDGRRIFERIMVNSGYVLVPSAVGWPASSRNDPDERCRGVRLPRRAVHLHLRGPLDVGDSFERGRTLAVSHVRGQRRREALVPSGCLAACTSKGRARLRPVFREAGHFGRSAIHPDRPC